MIYPGRTPFTWVMLEAPHAIGTHGNAVGSSVYCRLLSKIKYQAAFTNEQIRNANEIIANLFTFSFFYGKI